MQRTGVGLRECIGHASLPGKTLGNALRRTPCSPLWFDTFRPSHCSHIFDGVEGRSGKTATPPTPAPV